MVHWNRSKYPSPNVAAGHGDGLAVLGILLEVKDGEEHPELAKLVPYIDKIPFCGNKVTISEQMDPTNFIPNNPKMPKRFWTYQGSLTTPPLLESVIWIVFQQPLKISKQQVDIYALFRNKRFCLMKCSINLIDQGIKKITVA